MAIPDRMRLTKNILVSVAGPTAVGKTAFAIRLARHFRTEIISADSRQFFKELHIGTAKPDREELAAVHHHFIDSHSIRESYNAGQFEKDALELLEGLFEQHRVVVAVGGSGLYFKALWEGMDEMPEADPELRKSLSEVVRSGGLPDLLQELKAKDPVYYDRVDRNNPQRIMRAIEVIRTSGKPYSRLRDGKEKQPRSFRNIKIGLNMDREVLYRRIDDRMDKMIRDGLFEEAGRLVRYKGHNALQTVGYSEIFGFFEGKYDKEEAVRLLKRNSRRYAKRQLTWFGRDPEIQWMKPEEHDRAIRFIEEGLNV